MTAHEPSGEELLRSTGAVRAFTSDPVDPALVHELLDEARFAPSGGNRQPWWDDYIAAGRISE